MPRYIDADALIERLKFKRDETDISRKKYSGLECAIAQVQKAPDADVVPRSEVVSPWDGDCIPYDVANALKEKAIEKAKREVAMEIFEEIIKPIYYKIPPKLRPIFRSDSRDFDGGYRDGKTDAFVEVLMLIAELERKYGVQ